jgi:hypothetical protein
MLSKFNLNIAHRPNTGMVDGSSLFSIM